MHGVLLERRARLKLDLITLRLHSGPSRGRMHDGAASCPSEVDELLAGERERKTSSSSVRIYCMHRIGSVHTYMLQHRSSSAAFPTHRSTILSGRRRWRRWAGN